jgi:hypothetical protein
VDFADLLVFDESLPSRGSVRLLVFGNKGTYFRVGQEEQLTRVQSQYVCELNDDLFGRMAFCSLKMADVRDRGVDTPSNIFLGEFKLAATFPDDSTKAQS